MKKLSLNQQSALNIIGSVVVVAINVAINFLLSPFIVSHLGVEANGYITLANNFVSYIALVTIALNSMSGRFILIEHRRGNHQEANEYYSSILMGDWILAAVFLLPMIFFVIFIDKIINIPSDFLFDTRILFSIVFLNYILNLCMPQWATATYCTNNLYLRSLKNAVVAVVRALTIFLLFSLFQPHSYYVSIAATVMSAVSLFMDYAFYKKLMPELQWKIKYFRKQKIKTLISSGIWNTVAQCGNLLLEGLDILIANLFINPVASGVLALSKIAPNMINQITGTVATTYGPRLTYLFAEGKWNEMEHEIKNNIMIVSVLANIPIGIFLAFGSSFYELWVPSQDARQLWTLSAISLTGMLFAGLSQCIVNVFGVVNRLKLNSLVMIATGLINVTGVFLLLKYTTLGIYSVVAVSAFVSIVRIFCFTMPYAASLIKSSWVRLAKYMLKGVSNVVVPLLLGVLVSSIFTIQSWFTLIVAISVSAALSFVVDCFIILNKSQRQTILQKLHLI